MKNHLLYPYIASCLLLTALSPSNAEAQFETLLEKVTDLQFSTLCWSDIDSTKNSTCFNNLGIEVLWNLGRLPKPVASSGTQEKLTRMEIIDGDTTYVYEMVPIPAPSGGPWLIELGLGWSQVAEIEMAGRDFQVYGSVREFPSVSFYATYTDLWGQPYVGIRSGLIRLQNAQLVTPTPGDTLGRSSGFFGSSDAFQLGGVAGIALEIFPKNVHLTVEYSYMRRNFPSVSWATSPTTTLPDDFPRSLDFSGHSLAMGIQLKLREAK